MIIYILLTVKFLLFLRENYTVVNISFEEHSKTIKGKIANLKLLKSMLIAVIEKKSRRKHFAVRVFPRLLLVQFTYSPFFRDHIKWTILLSWQYHLKEPSPENSQSENGQITSELSSVWVESWTYWLTRYAEPCCDYRSAYVWILLFFTFNAFEFVSFIHCGRTKSSKED